MTLFLQKMELKIYRIRSKKTIRIMIAGIKNVSTNLIFKPCFLINTGHHIIQKSTKLILFSGTQMLPI